MRILMVAANTERINLPTLPLGAALVAAAARTAGHDVRFLDLMCETEPVATVLQTIDSVQPDVIGVSVRNIDDQEMINPTFLLDKVRPIVSACRQASSAPVVLGGAGYSIFPTATLEYLGADYGICGEGEAAFPALLAAIQGNGDPTYVPGVHLPGRAPREPRATVDQLDGPLPAGDELWQRSDLADPDLWVPVQTRRGCPYNCSYCSTPSIEGHRMRTRSPRLVAEQVGRMVDAGVRQIQVVDNIFNIPGDHALELCRELAALKADLGWQCIVYPRAVNDELVAAMARAGCRAVSLGFEAGNDRMLRSYGKRFDTAEVRRISDLFAVHGIRRFGFLLLGGPGESRSTVSESLDFVESLDLDMLRVTIGVRIYPGTPLAATAADQGVIAADDDLLSPRFYMTRGLEEFVRRQVGARGLASPRSDFTRVTASAGREGP